MCHPAIVMRVILVGKYVPIPVFSLSWFSIMPNPSRFFYGMFYGGTMAGIGLKKCWFNVGDPDLVKRHTPRTYHGGCLGHWRAWLCLGFMLWVGVLAFTSSAQAQTQTSKACSPHDLKQLGQAFAKGVSWSARFSQQSANASSPTRIEQASGRLEYQFPGKMRWHYTRPDEQLLVSNGKTAWLYDPLLNNVIVQALEVKGAYTPLRIFLGLEAIGKSFVCSSSNAKVKGGMLRRLTLTPRKADGITEHLVFGFAGLQGNLRQLRIVDVHGGWQNIDFHQVQKHPPFAADYFVFHPPAGTEVIKQ